ncbi:hypothetical protein CYLTODRAFT_440683 [Cylindrobasidium torrendii FP15055 ss-10]|uniref:Uncharacterized protein n=1 Tax=Cylindrobasidium torrendii FP15055 ss-10 TaxID=1314674 RepID=A0A0D7BQ10_9AGAR|nr:hypothetical protein CYLTODRAFT_440683 [Cylindrobasidium torrendii FP15055 ss-10]
MSSASRLPLELLEYIISWAFTLHSPSGDLLHVPSKPSWGAVSGFSLASKTCRAIFLEYWFMTLYMAECQHSDFENLFSTFPDICTRWTRHLHCVLPIDLVRHRMHVPLTVARFEKLQTIRLGYCGLHSKRTYAGTHSALSSHRGVDSFSIYNVLWPSPIIMKHISHTFIGLRYLAIHGRTIWCGLCYTNSTPAFASPIPRRLRYENSQGLGLPALFSKCLSSLHSLEFVSISVPIVDGGQTLLTEGDGGNEFLWSGECDDCITRNYVDEIFRNDWVERKRNGEPRLPSLQVVEWKFTDLIAEEDDEEAVDEADSPSSSSGDGNNDGDA